MENNNYFNGMEALLGGVSGVLEEIRTRTYQQTFTVPEIISIMRIKIDMERKYEEYKKNIHN